MVTSRKYSCGFTLMELIVVIVITGLLASMVAPRVMSYFADSRVKTARLELETIASALDVFKLDTGSYPETDEGLLSLMSSPGEGKSWQGPYLDHQQQIIDPWGNPYQYQKIERGQYKLMTAGADHAEGGNGEDSDLLFTAGGQL